MNVKELKTLIKKETKKANTRIKRATSKKKGPSKAVQEELDVLRRKGIIGARGKAITGFRGKTKAELQAQARELQYFNQWRGTETKAVRDATNLAKYQSFILNNPDFKDYSYQDWRDLVETFGSTQDFLQSFGYENIKELHKEITRNKEEVNLAQALRSTLRKTRGEGLTQEDVIDILRSKLFNDTVH